LNKVSAACFVARTADLQAVAVAVVEQVVVVATVEQAAATAQSYLLPNLPNVQSSVQVAPLAVRFRRKCYKTLHHSAIRSRIYCNS
jgi:hypothetical protein